MVLKNKTRGFTIVEVLIVIIIIGVILAIVVPRAYRANIDAKYNLVRQAASELANWGNEWAERTLEAQDSSSTCNLNHHVATLAGVFTGDAGSGNWVFVNDNTAGGCRGGATGDPIQSSVSAIMPQEKQPRNPFTGASYFSTSNDGSNLQEGLLYLGQNNDGTYLHYYFVFTGTDSTGTDDFYAGMGDGSTLTDLRNGVFFARLIP
jgi:prepilin-type N-terminal cleavage/methylation domain-containing protein